MYRLYIYTLAVMAVSGQVTYDLCKKCNRSYHDLRTMYERNLVQNVFHLPEEDHTEKLEKRQWLLSRDNRNSLPEYRSLCETVTETVQLDDSEYEYQPPLYHEVYCKSNALLDRLQRANPSKQKCVYNGFHCVQRSRTLILVRRRWENECWEPFVKQIPSGCDCMWPKSVLGDITKHY
ncbi:hypothetical protein QLX08_003360 [Tetragonisca angustula]|uniref:Uncharacterized protein n=2 Tax=Tetragonisca angustula TaxID=166442 RepID=A0AAW1A6L5_9HYME